MCTIPVRTRVRSYVGVGKTDVKLASASAFSGLMSLSLG
jgi:hypothetical protein